MASATACPWKMSMKSPHFLAIQSSRATKTRTIAMRYRGKTNMNRELLALKSVSMTCRVPDFTTGGVR